MGTRLSLLFLYRLTSVSIVELSLERVVIPRLWESVSDCMPPFVRVCITVRPSFVPSRHRQSPFVRVRITVNRPTIVVPVCQSSYNCPHARLPSRFVIGVPSFVRVRITVRRLAIAPSSRFSVVYYDALRRLLVWSFP